MAHKQLTLIFSMVLVLASGMALAHRNHGSQNGEGSVLIDERHIIVPSKRGCVCVDAITKSVKDKAETKMAYFKECVESVGLPQQQLEAGRNLDKAAAEAGRRMAGLQRTCGKIVLDYSPGNITQECFERGNMAFKMHEGLMKFIEDTGDKKTDFVTCLADKLNYLNGDRTGVNLDTFRSDVQNYFAEDAVEEALSHIQGCYDSFGTFDGEESVDEGLEEFLGCVMQGCL